MYYRDGWYKLNFGQDELVSGNIILIVSCLTEYSGFTKN